MIRYLHIDNEDDALPQAIHMSSNVEQNDKSGRVIMFFILVAVVLGGWQAWNDRFTMNADGMSYLDMGDAYLRGDWNMAVNTYWSPLYSWVVALALLICKPSPFWEFPLVHLVNFIIFLCTLACFHFFLVQLINWYRYRRNNSFERHFENYSEWVLITLGYSLFIWSSIDLIQVSTVTPDMSISGFVYLVFGLLLRIQRGLDGWLTFIMLGLVLGLSYLAKVIMFPLSFVFLLVSLFLTGNIRKTVPRSLAAIVMFLMISTPLIIALSVSKGRFTYGESGKLNYALYVSGVTFWIHGPTPASDGSMPKYSTKKIFDNPPIYAFENSRGGSYPGWYDPTHWYEGLPVHFSLIKQLRILKRNIKDYIDIFFIMQPVLIGSAIVLYYMSRRRWLCIRDVLDQWYLIVPPLAVIAIYSLVHVETRFLGGSIVVLWLALFSAVRIDRSHESRMLLSCIPIVAAIVIMTGEIHKPLLKVYDWIGKTNMTGSKPSHTHFQIAEALRAVGVRPGDKVASIGMSFDHYWARLARVQIVSEWPTESYAFYNTDDITLNRVMEAFASAGAKAVIMNNAVHSHCERPASNWKKIGDTTYYLYSLMGK